MKFYQDLISFISLLTLSVIWKQFKTVDKYLVKDDEERISSLLKSDEDKARFRQAVDELIKDNERSKDITLNDKNITISI